MFIRKKEDDIRISLQELSQMSFNEDEVIAELQTTITDISRSRQAIPQMVELQSLSELNRHAKERGRNMVAQQQQRGVYHTNLHLHVPYDYSSNSSPDEGGSSTLV